jgi:hypothetical protein
VQSLGSGWPGGWRRLQSPPTNIYVGTPTSTGQWMITGRAFYAQRHQGFDVPAAIRRYFGADGTSFWGATYGRGFSREEIRNVGDLFFADSDTVRAELDARLGRRLRAAAFGSTSRQERPIGPLRQHTLSASLRVEFRAIRNQEQDVL